MGGDIAVGMQTLRQTVFRPVARWNPYRTLRDMFGIREPPDIGTVPGDLLGPVAS